MCNLSNRNYLRQTPNIVNGKYSLTKSESDLVYMLLTEVDKNDEDFKDYVFTKEELENKIGVKIDSKQLMNTAERLMNKVIKIVKSHKEWELMSWFSYFKYDNGLITCSFDKRLKPYLLDMKQYVLADIRQLVQMKSDYSRRIYLMLKERSKFGVRKFDLQELMENLQVPRSYKIYNRFKVKIIAQAVKDINKYTDIEIERFEEHKRIRKVTHITFHTKKNWSDIRAMISWIREQYVNTPLYENHENRLIQCDESGLLYYADDQFKTLDKKTADKTWDYFHDHREELYCFNQNEDTEPARLRKIVEESKYYKYIDQEIITLDTVDKSVHYVITAITPFNDFLKVKIGNIMEIVIKDEDALIAFIKKRKPKKKGKEI
jgi:hypothetical protein